MHILQSKCQTEARKGRVYVLGRVQEGALKLKLLVFAGLGEPLLHPQIAEMAAYAKKREVAGTVRIITNASLLTHKMSDSLIEAGLDSLKISLQGVTEEAHHKWGRHFNSFSANKGEYQVLLRA